jgi:hypothetical protein
VATFNGAVSWSYSDYINDTASHSYTVKAFNGCGTSAANGSASGYAKQTPATPSGVSASQGTYCGYVHVTWNSASGVTTYYVYRDGSNAGSTSGTSYNDTPGNTSTHSYTVVANNNCGNSSTSGSGSGYAGSAPSTPSGVNASQGTYCGYVYITWNSVSGATGYQVYRDGSMVGSPGGTSYNDNLSDTSSHSYTVTANNSCGTSGASSSASGYAKQIPTTPSGVSASQGTYCGYVAVTWSSVSGATGYYVYRDGIQVGSPSSTSYSDTVSDTSSHSYTVKAYNSCGASGASGSVSGYVNIVTIVTTNSPSGGGTTSGGGTVPCGSGVTLTATTNLCYSFVSWTENGTVITNSPTYTFTVATNRTLVANFAQITYSINTSSSPSGGGTASGGGTVNCGSSVTVTATTNSCYGFVSWTENGNVVSTSPSYTFTASSNRTLVANFSQITYLINTSSSPSGGGTTGGGGTKTCGTSVTVTATTNTCYSFVNWMENGNVVSTSPSYTFTASSNRTLVANFAQITYSINTSSSPSGSGTTSGGGTVNCGSSVTVTATTNSCYSFVNWTENGNVVSTSPSYTFKASSNRTLVANFSQISYVIATTNSPFGAGTTSGGGTKLCGTNVTVIAKANSGCRFVDWMEGGTEVSTSTNYSFIASGNRTLVANFTDIQAPTNTISSPISGQRWSNGVFTVKGTAKDNLGVSNVWCLLNGTDWYLAASTNGWTNWSAAVNLTPGTNIVQAYAVDTTGNKSTTNSVSFQFVVTNQLGVRAIGLGTIKPNYSNAWLEIGRNYSITSAPASGFVFTNWVLSTNWIGGVTTSHTNLQFMMQSNLTLQVSFVDVTKPTLSITVPTSGQKMTNALANVKGTASDNWRVTNVWYQLNGGSWNPATSTNGWTNWTVTLTLVAGTNTVKAYAVDLGANFSTTNSVSVVSSNTFKLQLAFTNSLPLKTNGLVFILQLSTGLNGHIQVSTNLTSWTTLTNFVGTSSTIVFRDSAATNYNRRFYRAVVP